MKRILLLCRKELKRYFDTPLAYITIIVFLLISGWMFSSTIFLINRATIENFIFNVPLLLMFLAPAIAMQLLAGEYHSGTMEILGTLPLKDSEIITGKFLAAFSLLISSILLTLVFPLSISFLGNVDWGQVAGAYLGMILIGGTFLFAGLFASSVSNNQVVAFIAGFAISFALFIMGKVTHIIPSYIRPVITYIGIDSHWESIARGVIDLRDIVYFISLWAFFYYGTLLSFSRKIRVGVYKAFSISFFVGILIVVNILSETIVLRVDMTENTIYSLSKASKRIIKSLDDNIIIKAYFSRDLPAQYQAARKYLNDLLHEYHTYSKAKINFKFYDPSGDENIAREAMVSGIPPLKFTESAKEKFEIKQGYMGVVILYEDKTEVMPIIENIRGLEYDLTTRIKKITSKENKVIGYIGDPGISEQLKENIISRYDFIEISSLELLDEKKVSSVIVNAGTGISREKMEILSDIADKKIPMGIFADRYDIDLEKFSGTETEVRINEFLDEYGMKIGRGLILDRQNQRIGITTRQGMFTIQNVVNYPYFPLVTDIDRENPAVRDLDVITFSFVSPIEIDKNKVKNYDFFVLAKTSKNSWLDEGVDFMSPMREYFPPGKDSLKQYPVVCVAKERNASFRIILTSNSRFIDKKFMASEANENFFLNIIDWLTEDVDLISIRSKGITERPLKDIVPVKKTMMKYINIFFIPLVVLGFGIYRWKTVEIRNIIKKQSLIDG